MGIWKVKGRNHARKTCDYKRSVYRDFPGCRDDLDIREITPQHLHLYLNTRRTNKKIPTGVIGGIFGHKNRRTTEIYLHSIAPASVLAMIPLTRQIFWGPMAVAIMGGLIVATVLTCLFLPALYAAWFRVREPDADSGAQA